MKPSADKQREDSKSDHVPVEEWAGDL